MAGHIIPAIATTNAIIAGMIVLQAKNIIKGRRDKCYNAFLTYGTRRKNLIAREQLVDLNPACAVCHVDRAIVCLNPIKVTLKDLISQVLQQYGRQLDVELAIEDIIVLEGPRLLYDEDLTINLEKTLDELDLGQTKFIKFDFIPLDIPLLLVIDATLSDTGLIESEFRLIPPDKRIKPAAEDSRDDEPFAEASEDDDLVSEPPTKQAKLSTEGPIKVDDDIQIL